jgi:hypothetical protein
LASRPESDSPYVFLRRNCSPIGKRTKGGNESRYITNLWTDLHKRIAKDHDTSAWWNSFGKLRKTSVDKIRDWCGAEIADLQAGHGGKKIVDHYANRRWRKLFKAQAKLRRWLRPVLDAVADPLPERAGVSTPRISKGTIRRIQELRSEGHSMKKVAQLLELCVDTVRRYSPRKKRVP